MKGGYQNRQGAGGLRGQRFSFQKGESSCETGEERKRGDLIKRDLWGHGTYIWYLQTLQEREWSHFQ